MLHIGYTEAKVRTGKRYNSTYHSKGIVYQTASVLTHSVTNLQSTCCSLCRNKCWTLFVSFWRAMDNKWRHASCFDWQQGQNTETIESLLLYCNVYLSTGVPFWQKWLLCKWNEVYLVPTPIEHNFWSWVGFCNLKKARLPTQNIISESFFYNLARDRLLFPCAGS